jgi:lipopolysaccharide export system permease protein
MYTIWNDRYLILELFRGDNYTEMLPKSPGQESEFSHNHFDYSKLVFNLSSFEMSRTDIQLFASNKIMRNISELHRDIDSVKREGENLRKFAPANFLTYFSHFMRQRQAPLMQENQLDSLSNRLRERWERDSLQWIQSARNQIQSIKNYTEANKDRLKNFYRDSDVFEVEILKKYTQAIACLIMFLLGAPLGAIIRKGGFGVPVLISIFFFIIYYVLSITGEKWSKEDLVEVSVGMWATNFLLFWAGLYFLAKARSDSSLLDNNYFTQFFSFIGRLIRQMFSGKKSKEISS